MTERLHFHFSLSCTGEGNGNPLQCSCLENPRDGGAWWAAVCGVAQSWTQLKRLSSSSSSIPFLSSCFLTLATIECYLGKLHYLSRTPHSIPHHDLVAVPGESGSLCFCRLEGVMHPGPPWRTLTPCLYSEGHDCHASNFISAHCRDSYRYLFLHSTVPCWVRKCPLVFQPSWRELMSADHLHPGSTACGLCN